MASPEETPAKRLDAPLILGLPEELLEVILRRLPTLVDVGSAACACPTFHRVIASDAFRRRLGSVHKAPFLGFLHGRFYPIKAPHPSARYARDLARVAHFSFAFVPGGPWLLRDMRDGRALLESSVSPRKFAVADPVFKRHRLLPPVPLPQQRRLHLELSLVPASEEKDEKFYRVICVAVSRAHLVAFVLSSSNEMWCAFPFRGWGASIAEVSAETLWFRLITWRYWADGCFYWRVTWARNKLLVLDTRRMEFSFIDIPPAAIPPLYRFKQYYCSAIAETREGRAQMFILQKDTTGRQFTLCSLRRNDAGSAYAWQSMMKVQVEISSCRHLIIAGATERYLLLKETENMETYTRFPVVRKQYFLLNLDAETLQLEKVCDSVADFLHMNLCVGFPSSLSLASI